MRIYNNNGAYKSSCWEKTIASHGYRAACHQRTCDSGAEKFYVTYSQLPPNYSFSTGYTLNDHLERLYEEPPKLVTKAPPSTDRTVYRVGEYQEKSDQNCFIFAN